MGSSASSCCGEKVGEGYVGGDSSPWRLFSYKELHAATNGFSEDYMLGEGGFGSVYWGKTSDGHQIAVKKLKAMNSKAEMEFAVEVEVLGRVRHKNLLGLRGYCAGEEHRMIVYDYMPNLSLLSHLHGQFADDSRLDWKKRIDIIIGSAQGLVYLHHEAKPHIIHRDIKASNVLLDSDFRPLVADFGFAKLMPDGVSHMTTRVKGTLGYLAPEYAMWGKVSESCDVYSFGILLLELISGRKPIERLAGGVKRTITEWAEPLLAAGRRADLVDPRLRADFDDLQLRRVLHAASRSVQAESDRRPTMQRVLEIVSGTASAADPVKNSGLASGERINPVTSSGELIRIASIKYEKDLMEQDDDSNDGDIDCGEYTSVTSSELAAEGDSRSRCSGFEAVEVQRMKDRYGKYSAGNGTPAAIRR
ncbi:PTI1-like tyrosine-protein kinase [Apostasia shenzhenica]|uniref:PTI1-like tyrosine-protein kinase n=1 Tax=Apostasia shenzhenica TaxID=1088818 RepID=A0A2I0BGW5_9ASPA|nr:PTI1-like tyrosine-protein kinase [Apostasia shenzhenica]